jgi:serine/threonine-protein kinase SRPK3
VVGFHTCKRFSCTSYNLHTLGRWIGDVKISSNSLEEFEENLKGKEKALFLRIMRKMLRWVPEKRMSAVDLLDDPWLNS